MMFAMYYTYLDNSMNCDSTFVMLSQKCVKCSVSQFTVTAVDSAGWKTTLWYGLIYKQKHKTTTLQ